MVKQVASFTFSDLLAETGVVHAILCVELHRGAPSPQALAGICIPDGDGPGLVRVITLERHLGRDAWCLITEHAAQKRNEHIFGALPELIAQFEAICQVELPDIKVVELGVGVYSAQTRYASENPWAMVDGEVYAVSDPCKGKRCFVADVRNGRTLICFLDKQGNTSETFEPAVVLSAADWKSLAPAKDCAGPRPSMARPH